MVLEAVYSKETADFRDHRTLIIIKLMLLFLSYLGK